MPGLKARKGGSPEPQGREGNYRLNTSAPEGEEEKALSNRRAGE